MITTEDIKKLIFIALIAVLAWLIFGGKKNSDDSINFEKYLIEENKSLSKKVDSQKAFIDSAISVLGSREILIKTMQHEKDSVINYFVNHKFTKRERDSLRAMYNPG